MLMSLIGALLPAPPPLVPTPMFGAAQVMRRELKTERTPLDMQKLLYIAQMVHLGRHGVPIFPERFNASMMGPVIPKLQRELKRNRSIWNPIQATTLSDTALAVLAEVAREFGKMSSAKLVAITHGRVSAWANAFKPNSAKQAPYSGLPITHAAMAAEYHEKTSAK